jgi:predicted solute-binding protein
VIEGYEAIFSSSTQKTRKEILMSRKTAITSAIAILTFSTILVTAQMQMPDKSANKGSEASAAPKTLTGIVSDSMCGAHHMAKDKSPAECARMCVKQGMKYALLVGDKVYTLERP